MWTWCEHVNSNKVTSVAPAQTRLEYALLSVEAISSFEPNLALTEVTPNFAIDSVEAEMGLLLVPDVKGKGYLMKTHL